MAFSDPHCLVINSKAQVYSAAFSPDGKTIATETGFKLYLHDSKTGQQLLDKGRLDHTTSFRGITYDNTSSREGATTLATGCNGGGTIHLWEMSSAEGTSLIAIGKLTGHRNRVNSISFAAYIDGRYLVSGSTDRSIRLWDMATRKSARPWNAHADEVTSVAAADCKSVVSGSLDTTVRIWDMTTGAQLQCMKGHDFGVSSVACPPCAGGVSSDKVVVSGSGRYDNSIRVWDILTGKEIAKLIGHINSVNSVAFSPDGKCIVSAGEDGAVWLWDLSMRRPVHTLWGHSGWVNLVTFSRDGKCIISAGEDGCRIWNI